MAGELSQSVKRGYQAMSRIETQLGGGEGVEGIYGSLAPTSMQRIVDAMKRYGLSRSSVFVDVGAGLGRPMIHAHLDPGVRKTVGFELDAVKCQKAHTFIHRLGQMGYVAPSMSTTIVCGNIAERNRLPVGTTHLYAFWQGFSEGDRQAVGRLFRLCNTARVVCVVQNVRDGFAVDPENAMHDLGFGPLRLATKIRVQASGSGGGFTAFVFVKRKRSRNVFM